MPRFTLTISRRRAAASRRHAKARKSSAGGYHDSRCAALIPADPLAALIPADPLAEFVAADPQRGGCAAAETRTVARRLLDSYRVGHYSHGVLRIGTCLGGVRKDWLVPNAKPTDLFESDTVAIIGRDREFCGVIGEYAGTRRIEKAAVTGIALVGLRNCMPSTFIAVGVCDASGGAGGKRLVERVKRSPLSAAPRLGLAPGDFERATRASPLRDGIPLDDTTWRNLLDVAASVGVDASRAVTLAA